MYIIHVGSVATTPSSWARCMHIVWLQHTWTYLTSRSELWPYMPVILIRYIYHSLLISHAYTYTTILIYYILHIYTIPNRLIVIQVNHHIVSDIDAVEDEGWKWVDQLGEYCLYSIWLMYMYDFYACILSYTVLYIAVLYSLTYSSICIQYRAYMYRGWRVHRPILPQRQHAYIYTLLSTIYSWYIPLR